MIDKSKLITNIDSLKKEIVSYMDTGYQGDKLVCKDILACIDRHTKQNITDKELVILDLYGLTPFYNSLLLFDILVGIGFLGYLIGKLGG